MWTIKYSSGNQEIFKYSSTIIISTKKEDDTMGFRNYLMAAGMAVSLSLVPACEKKAAKPDGVECGKGVCRELYSDQDNGLKVPNLYKDKRVRLFGGECNRVAVTAELYNISGDSKPDVLVLAYVPVDGSVSLTKKVMYFSSKFDGKVDVAFVDDLKSDGGLSQFDGYWDYCMKSEGSDITLDGLVDELKGVLK